MGHAFRSRLSSVCKAHALQWQTDVGLCGDCLLWLQENAFNYDKGVLAEILEPIMGKGLIPADLETWKPRRRAIVPAFHKAYLEAMVKMFGRCTEVAVEKLDALASSGHVSHACDQLLQLYQNLPLPQGTPWGHAPDAWVSHQCSCGFCTNVALGFVPI